MTLVYHYHPHTFAYVGATEADESPLEPGVFLVPAYATRTPAPDAVQEGHTLSWNEADGAWQETLLPVPEAVPEAVPETLPDALTQVRAERNARLQAVDWVAIRFFTQGVPYPAEWATYVQALRDLPTACEPTVDADGRLEPASVPWPPMPVA